MKTRTGDEGRTVIGVSKPTESNRIMQFQYLNILDLITWDIILILAGEQIKTAKHLAWVPVLFSEKRQVLCCPQRKKATTLSKHHQSSVSNLNVAL